MRLFFISCIIILFSFVSYSQTSGIQVIDDGIGQLQKGNTEKALSIFLSAKKQYPNNIVLNFSLGNAYGTLVKFDSAIFYYSKTIKLNPKFTAAYVNRAIIYYQLKDSVKGEADERIAVR